MYVPVMKNRTVEMNVLEQLGQQGVFDDKVLPLIELIQEKIRTNNKNSFIQDLEHILESCPNMKVMIDLFKSSKLRTTTDAIREYVTMATRHPEFCIDVVSKVGKYSDRVIPVISYMTENISLERIGYETTEFRKVFPKVAFRLKVQDFENTFSFVESLVNKNDIVILDIDSASHMNPMFKKLYKRISDSKKEIGFVSVIINSNKPENLTNKEMTDREPIAQIDNSLRELYHTTYMSKFDGFGDYACIVASLPSQGGSISPVGVFYSNENNFFVSFRGRTANLSEFQDYITPSILASEYWAEYSEAHHKACLGCKEIQLIADGGKSGKNQAQWKMIMMLHYIYTLYETNA